MNFIAQWHNYAMSNPRCSIAIPPQMLSQNRLPFCNPHPVGQSSSRPWIMMEHATHTVLCPPFPLRFAAPTGHSYGVDSGRETLMASSVQTGLFFSERVPRGNPPASQRLTHPIDVADACFRGCQVRQGMRVLRPRDTFLMKHTAEAAANHNNLLQPASST